MRNFHLLPYFDSAFAWTIDFSVLEANQASGKGAM